MAKLRDTADWTGIDIRTINVGAAKHDKFLFRGIRYVNETELMLAQLLWKMRLPNTPNVRFIMDMPPGSKLPKRVFVPDFIFNGKACVWDDGNGQELIHGIEAKGGGFPARAVLNVRLLREQRGIHIMLLNRKDISHYTKLGGLPIQPLLP